MRIAAQTCASECQVEIEWAAGGFLGLERGKGADLCASDKLVVLEALLQPEICNQSDREISQARLCCHCKLSDRLLSKRTDYLI
jgi:hypothetical protein